MSVLKQITTRAKIIRRSQGGSWRSALKKAGAEFRKKGGKSMAGRKKVYKRKDGINFGTKQEYDSYMKNKSYSKKIDLSQESRDFNRKKKVGATRSSFKKFSTVGSAGGAHNEMLLRNLSERNRAMITAETKLIHLKRLLQVTPRGIDRSKVRGYIKDQKKYMRVVRTEIRMLKSLIK